MRFSSMLRRLGPRFQLLLHLYQLRITVLPPIDVCAVFLVERDGQANSAFKLAQFDITMLPIIQVNSVILRNGIRFIEAIFKIKELRD